MVYLLTANCPKSKSTDQLFLSMKTHSFTAQEMIDISGNPNFVFMDGTLMDNEMTQIIYCTLSKSGDYTIPNIDHHLHKCISKLLWHDFDHDPGIGQRNRRLCIELTPITIPESV